MTNTQTKPTLVFFQYRYDDSLPPFLLNHVRDHVRCLSEFFNVTVINEDCDYQEVCDQHQPDLVLFESGVNHLTCRRLKITNIRACPTVPKLGLHNADSFCNARSGFISDMDHWGVETFFAICTTAPEHTPEIADNMFVWPNCIDPDTYRDYGEWKNIPVLFTGNTRVLYPWRQQIVKLVSEHYPSLICPHPGYEPGSAAQQVLVGTQYARMINASMMVPACGTVAKEAVRKHFEIPACKSCLVTEQSEALDAAGFVDMHNCVFATEKDVLDKIGYLFRNPDELQRITERGHQLVHASHTYKQRDQILQWYRLNRNVQPHQKIVQTNPFGRLTIVDKSSGIKSAHVSGEGLHLALLSKGDERLVAGRYDEAEDHYLRCLNYMRWMPEPRLRVALCKLYQGDAKTARSWISEQLEFILAGYGAADPDPVEWAYYIVTLLCLGELDEADRSARQFAWLHHPELERARWSVRVLRGERPEALPLPAVAKRRRTIHRLPTRDWTGWRDQVCIMLRACGQQAFADTLGRCACTEHIAPETDRIGTHNAEATGLEGALEGQGNHVSANFKAVDASRGFRRRLRYRAAGVAVKRVIARSLHRAEATFGYFLPYHLSAMRDDEFFGRLRDLGKEENIKTAIFVGAARSAGSMNALLAGIFEKDADAQIFCISEETRQFRRMEKAFGGRIKCHGVRSSSPAEFLRGVEETLEKVKKDNHIGVLDAVLVDGAALKDHSLIGDELQTDIRQARLVVLDNTNCIYNYQNRDRLLRDPDYVLIADNPGLRNGYAIFRRRRAAARIDRESNVELTRVCG